MKYKDRVAVVTGGASGIGKALVEKCLEEEMKVVVADVESKALFNLVDKLRDIYGDNVAACETDVSNRHSVEKLAKTALEKFSAVHMVFNNAGVGAGFDFGGLSYDDVEWVLGVNLMGTIYGVKTFLPILEEQEVDCHIINTASTAGLVCGYGSVPYVASKHGVVALSEALYFDLAERESNVKVSILCPGATETNILNSERNRPKDLSKRSTLPRSRQYLEVLGKTVESIKVGMHPTELANLTFECLRKNYLYIIPDESTKAQVLERAQSIVSGIGPKV